LAKYEGTLRLRGIESISDEGIKALAKCKGDVIISKKYEKALEKAQKAREAQKAPKKANP